MRIMMVSSSPGGMTNPHGGEALHVSSLSQALSKRGHRIAILARHSPNAPISLPGVEAIFSTKSLFPLALTKVIQIDPIVYLTTLRVLRTWGPDIVHLQYFISLSFAPIAAAAHLRIPVVATLHTYWPVCLRHQLCYNEDASCRQHYVRGVCAACVARGLRNQTVAGFSAPLVSMALRVAWWGRRRMLRTVARFIAPSAAVARSLTQSGYLADRIVIIPHGLPEEDFLIRPRKPSRVQPSVHLLYVGRLVPGKGVQYLLEALPLVRQVYQDLTLTVAGEGPFRPDLERLCASLGLTAITRFIGGQPRSRLPQLYAETDVVVIPTLSDVYAYVAIEAVAAGVPVVATNVGGIPEVVGDDAILVPPMDAVALAHGVLTVLADPVAAAERAKAAQERSLARFSFKTMVDRAEAVYSEARRDQVGSVRSYVRR